MPTKITKLHNSENLKNKFRSKTKRDSIIMPTAKILMGITVDGMYDNKNIKMTYISKKAKNKIPKFKTPKLTKGWITSEIKKEKKLLNKNNNFNSNTIVPKIDFIESIFSLTNYQDDFSIEYHEKDDETLSEAIINGKTVDQNLEDIRVKNNKIDILKHSPNIRKIIDSNNFFNDVIDKKIDYLKNDDEVKKLKSLFSNLNSNLEEVIQNNGKIVMNSQKYDENDIYRYIGKEYKCQCNDCKYINEIEESKDPQEYVRDIYQDDYSNLELGNQIPCKSYSKQLIKKENFLNSKNKKEEKNILSEELIDNNIIYSQSILNDLLLSKICSEYQEFKTIIESSKRKKQFLNFLLAEDMSLNISNKISVQKMINRLNDSEEIFLSNNELNFK